MKEQKNIKPQEMSVALHSLTFHVELNELEMCNSLLLIVYCVPCLPLVVLRPGIFRQHPVSHLPLLFCHYQIFILQQLFSRNNDRVVFLIAI